MAYVAFPKDLGVLSFGCGSKASVANGPQILLCHPCEDQSSGAITIWRPQLTRVCMAHLKLPPRCLQQAKLITEKR